MAAALVINSRLSAARLVRFSSRVSTSVSNDCKREVNAAARSQILCEPENRLLREALGVVSIFVAPQAAIDRLPQQIGQRQLISYESNALPCLNILQCALPAVINRMRSSRACPSFSRHA
jgi:hypothetical protein